MTNNKIRNYIDRYFAEGKYKNKLSNVMQKVLKWRNRYGVGHGALTQNKEDPLAFRYALDDNVNVEVSFIDLRNSDSSIVNLIAKVC